MLGAVRRIVRFGEKGLGAKNHETVRITPADHCMSLSVVRDTPWFATFHNLPRGCAPAVRWAALTAATSVVLVGPTAFAQRPNTTGVIDVAIVDSALFPIAGAVVAIEGTSLSVTSGASGRVRVLHVLGGSYLLKVRAIGYSPSEYVVDVEPTDTIRLSVVLHPTATVLEPARVIAAGAATRLAGFDERHRSGIGHFITAADIEKRNSVGVADLLVGIPSVRVVRAGTKEYAVNGRSRCGFDVFVDGVRLGDTDLHALPSPKEFSGIEVYTGPASIPLEFKGIGGGGFCGVILLWTK